MQHGNEQQAVGHQQAGQKNTDQHDQVGGDVLDQDTQPEPGQKAAAGQADHTLFAGTGEIMPQKTQRGKRQGPVQDHGIEDQYDHEGQDGRAQEGFAAPDGRIPGQ